jgi:hypothetical protein
VCEGIALVSEQVGDNRPWLGDRVVLRNVHIVSLWGVRRTGPRKKGGPTGSTLSTKLRHEIAERSIAKTELPRNLGAGPVVKKDGSERLEASMQRRGGMSEEVVAAGIIHGVTSKIVTRFSAIPPPELTLFHMELARCDQVESPENGSISWKVAWEGRRVSVLPEGNSDAKKIRYQRKNK